MLNRSVGSVLECIAVLGALLTPGLDQHAAAQSCEPGDFRWGSMFPGDGALDRTVNAFVVFDGELYVGGDFNYCMGTEHHNIARWNGHRWAAAGAGLYCSEVNALVYSLAAFDDPNTPEGATLYAGAINGVYRLPADLDDPNECWPKVAVTNGAVHALVVYGDSLYAGGEFTCIRSPDPNDPNAPCDPNDPNQARQYIARWDGTAWQDVGGGVDRDPNDPNGPIFALTVFDDGGGEALFAGGTFLHAGGTPAGRVARWRDGAWSALGDGIDDPNTVEVHALAGCNGRPHSAWAMNIGPIEFPDKGSILKLRGGTCRGPLEDGA